MMRRGGRIRRQRKGAAFAAISKYNFNQNRRPCKRQAAETKRGERALSAKKINVFLMCLRIFKRRRRRRENERNHKQFFFLVLHSVGKSLISQLTLKPLSATRWSSRVDALKPLRFQLCEIYDALFEIIQDVNRDAETKVKATGLAKNIQNYKLCGIFFGMIFCLK